LSADAQIYGLTATLRDEGRDFFESNGLPVVYELSVSQCLEDGFLNPFVLINIGLDLSESEQKIYDDISTSISKEEDRIKAAGRTVGMVFGRSFYSKFENALFKKYRQYVHMRKKLLYTSTSKVKKLVDIVVQEDKKIIVFGESVDMVDQVFEYLKSKLDYDNQRLIARYHSKMSSKQRDAILDEFRNSTNGILISAKALKQGVDIPDCSVGIIVSRTRNSNDAAQQLGRIVRKAEGKEQSKLYNLYIRNTKDEEWSKLALADFKDYEINY
jgi:superfamily II DNA or RNA helicase